MTTYRRPLIQLLGWSLFLTLSLNHFIANQNPFVGSVCLGLILIALSIQLVRLRKHGAVYVGLFLVSLVLLTAILLYIDGHIVSFPKRYYSTV